jgi:hypothetical protein
LWPLTNEPIANRCFESLDEIIVVLFARCRRLLQQQELIRGLTFFHWWPCCSDTPHNWDSDQAHPVVKDNVNSRWY